MLLRLLALILVSFHLVADSYLEKRKYHLSNERVDVVIPCVEKDLITLDLCIDGVRKNVENLGRIYVVSKKHLTNKAEWICEFIYPFSKQDIVNEVSQELNFEPQRLGWIYQQLLKLYAPLVIPNISSNVLVVDSDTVFLNPVKFVGKSGRGYYSPGSEYNVGYFEHMERLIPGLKKVNPKYSGIVHHMLFQRAVILDLFSTIERIHHVEPWKALCRCIDPKMTMISEYEIYFNYLLSTSDQVKIRKLKWINSENLKKINRYRKEGYHQASFHAYMRK